MSTGKARRPRVVGAVIAVAVVLVALGAAVAVMAGRAEVVDQVAVDKLTEIERLAPLDTHQLVVTPGVGQDNRWWNTIIAFMPAEVRLDNLKPTSDLGITHLGYSFSAADPALGLDQRYARMLYFQTDSAEHAKKVQGWLSSSIGAAQGAFSTTISSHTVVLAPAEIPILAEVPKMGGGLGDTAGFRQDTATREPGSLIWEDWGAYVKAAGASGGKPAQYAQFFYGATGFIKGSRWVGYSTSPEVGWSGTFQSGGMDSKLVSAAKVDAAIQSYSKVMASNSDGPTAVDGGVGNYLRDSFYAMHPGLAVPKSALGPVDIAASPVQPMMGSELLAFKPKSAGDTAFSFDPSAWLAGTSGTATSRPEGLSLFAYSIHGNEINLKVTVNAANKPDPASTPIQTFAPPPGPPVGSDTPFQTGIPDNQAVPAVP